MNDEAAQDRAPAEGTTAATAGQRARGLVEHFFRHEAGRLHGALLRQFGVRHLALVEDVAQEALMRAMHAWSIGGVPANPAAWITRVAINLARDALRHQRMAMDKEPRLIAHFEHLRALPEHAWDAADEIRDDTLRLLFVCCHPVLGHDAQVMLALKILCGFGNGEIARAFFSTEAAVEKRLTRAKQRLRDAGVAFAIPEGVDLTARLDGVLATLYLLFNEGYKASSGDALLREDLAREAIRLMQSLVVHPLGDRPEAHALLALMLLSAARFPSRVDEQGWLLRLAQQDRSRWDHAMIGEGMHHLLQAARGEVVSEYHLQAGVAALHCNAADYDSTDWASILRHYDALLRLRPSPVIALNRAVAVSNVRGPAAGLEVIAALAADDPALASNHLYHAVKADLHDRAAQPAEAIHCLRQALQRVHSEPERRFLKKRLHDLGAET